MLDEAAHDFTRQTGTKVVISFGSTAQLAQQIEYGAPFDVFAAADTEHIDSLVRKGMLLPESRAVYALGVLVVWTPNGDTLGVNGLEDLAQPSVRSIAIASPDVAPYGRAAVDALRRASLWPSVQAKVVYATNINTAKQFAATGNADVAFTAYSLVLKGKGRVIRVNPSLYKPIEQAIGVVRDSRKQALAKSFESYLINGPGQTLLRQSGYLAPSP